ncbi:MAG: SdiA-regulated domain-containing protein [Campylobacterota bacterium]|nr:SdiA-regulated domain-containing protein [Campylobacterota bacterium]
MVISLQAGDKVQKYKIAKVPEASGICYSNLRDSLFVANDEGKVYELTREGNRIRKVKLGKEYDLEGVACNDKEKLLHFAVEKSESILIVDMDSLKIIKEIKINRAYQNQIVIKKDKKSGIEGITIVDGEIYLSNQSMRAYPNKDASIVFTVVVNNDKAKISKIINHGFVDVAGLSYHNDILYMVSDKKNLLIKYDISKNKTLSIQKLPKFAQEGITFDNSGYIYFADDKGRVLKIDAKRFE